MMEPREILSGSPAAARAIDIERKIADWKARLPAHSISPALMAELDALEEALEEARCRLRDEQRRPHTEPTITVTASPPTEPPSGSI